MPGRQIHQLWRVLVIWGQGNQRGILNDVSTHAGHTLGRHDGKQQCVRVVGKCVRALT